MMPIRPHRKKYRFKPKQYHTFNKIEYEDISVPIYDDYGEVIRYKIEQIRVDREYIGEYYPPVHYTGPGVHDRYDILTTVIKCRCGKYTTNIGKCSDCGYYSANTNSIPIKDLHGDRSDNNLLEELFKLGRIGIDTFMRCHDTASVYSFDGTDCNQTTWWGG